MAVYTKITCFMMFIKNYLWDECIYVCLNTHYELYLKLYAKVLNISSEKIFIQIFSQVRWTVSILQLKVVFILTLIFKSTNKTMHSWLAFDKKYLKCLSYINILQYMLHKLWLHTQFGLGSKFAPFFNIKEIATERFGYIFIQMQSSFSHSISANFDRHSSVRISIL